MNIQKEIFLPNFTQSPQPQTKAHSLTNFPPDNWKAKFDNNERSDIFEKMFSMFWIVNFHLTRGILQKVVRLSVTNHSFSYDFL